MYKSSGTGSKATTPVNHARNRPQQTSALRSPSPKDATNSFLRRSTGSPAGKILASRPSSRKSPSAFVDNHERSKSRLSADELNDQHLLSLSQYEKYDAYRDEAQSFFERSVMGDAVLHDMLAKQSKQSTGQSAAQGQGQGQGLNLAAKALLERDVTESSALSALTSTDDEGTCSERTHAAAYTVTAPPAAPLSPSTGVAQEVVRHMTDEQLRLFLDAARAEVEARDR
eukprot:gene43203-52811_t